MRKLRHQIGNECTDLYHHTESHVSKNICVCNHSFERGCDFYAKALLENVHSAEVMIPALTVVLLGRQIVVVTDLLCIF